MTATARILGALSASNGAEVARLAAGQPALIWELADGVSDDLRPASTDAEWNAASLVQLIVPNASTTNAIITGFKAVTPANGVRRKTIAFKFGTGDPSLDIILDPTAGTSLSANSMRIPGTRNNVGRFRMTRGTAVVIEYDESYSEWLVLATNTLYTEAGEGDPSVDGAAILDLDLDKSVNFDVGLSQVGHTLNFVKRGRTAAHGFLRITKANATDTITGFTLDGAGGLVRFASGVPPTVTATVPSVDIWEYRLSNDGILVYLKSWIANST